MAVKHHFLKLYFQSYFVVVYHILSCHIILIFKTSWGINECCILFTFFHEWVLHISTIFWVFSNFQVIFLSVVSYLLDCSSVLSNAGNYISELCCAILTFDSSGYWWRLHLQHMFIDFHYESLMLIIYSESISFFSCVLHVYILSLFPRVSNVYQTWLVISQVSLHVFSFVVWSDLFSLEIYFFTGNIRNDFSDLRGQS